MIEPLPFPLKKRGGRRAKVPVKKSRFRLSPLARALQRSL
jgi:hypothetical protein